MSPDTWVYQGSNQWKDGGVYGAPGPIAGAGLPVAFVIAGGAGYWPLGGDDVRQNRRFEKIRC